MLKKIYRSARTIIRRRYTPQPHSIKEAIIKKYREHYGIQIFIETGTFLGEMVEIMKNSFKEVYSIELNEKLYKKAKEKFTKDSNVSIIHGDSGVVLSSLLEKITDPALFWLDGHYSGGVTGKGNLDTPIKSELDSIFKHLNKKHIILIDDARLFNGTDDYPTYKEVVLIAKKNGYTSKKESDIIAIYRP